MSDRTGSMDRFTLDEILVLTTAMNKLTPNEKQVLIRAVMKLTLDEPSKGAANSTGKATVTYESLENRRGKHPDAKFVGGFKHGPANSNAGRASASVTPLSSPKPINQMATPETPSPSGPIPRPPQIFSPTRVHQASRTTQAALSDSNDLARPKLQSTSPEPAKTAKPCPKVFHVVPSSPISPKSSFTCSSDESASELDKAALGSDEAISEVGTADTAVQCSGITVEGRRCKRRVALNPPPHVVNPDRPMERFCYQHRG